MSLITQKTLIKHSHRQRRNTVVRASLLATIDTTHYRCLPPATVDQLPHRSLLTAPPLSLSLLWFNSLSPELADNFNFIPTKSIWDLKVQCLIFSLSKCYLLILPLLLLILLSCPG